MTIAVLVPIATGDIDLKQLGEAVKSSYAWIALGAGILVALIAKNIVLLRMIRISRQRLCSGRFWQSAYSKGVAVGPLIGAGIAYLAMQAVKFFSG
ncbi:DUF441 family protein [Bacillus sp. SL00103]